MKPNWAEENLQTIRTLMERSAIYRRALAPIMLICGISGLAGGVAGWQWHIYTNQGFVLLWITTAGFALGSSILLVRQQALKEAEPFWSAPTRRVAQALTPSFLIGGVSAGVLAHWGTDRHSEEIWFLILIWCLCFGSGIHAAGFFMPRGMRWLGWVFVSVGIGLIGCYATNLIDLHRVFNSPHLLMATIFGGLHLAYGIYLYFTEKKNPVA